MDKGSTSIGYSYCPPSSGGKHRFEQRRSPVEATQLALPSVAKILSNMRANALIRRFCSFLIVVRRIPGGIAQLFPKQSKEQLSFRIGQPG